MHNPNHSTNVIRGDFEGLLDEVRLLWNVMTQSGERLHKQEPVTLGMRAVLEFLAVGGPATVPRIARSRHVTRQHIQSLVNALLGLDLVVIEPNPEHKRSVLVRLTPEGQKVIERIKRRELRYMGQLVLDAKKTDLKRAAETLRRVRAALESKP